MLLVGSANRDERAFPEPDRFDVHAQHREEPGLRPGHALLPRRVARAARRARRARGGLAALPGLARSSPPGSVRVHSVNVRGFAALPDPARRMSAARRTAIVTGASSGIGAATARRARAPRLDASRSAPGGTDRLAEVARRDRGGGRPRLRPRPRRLAARLDRRLLRRRRARPRPDRRAREQRGHVDPEPAPRRQARGSALRARREPARADAALPPRDSRRMLARAARRPRLRLAARTRCVRAPTSRPTPPPRRASKGSRGCSRWSSTAPASARSSCASARRAASSARAWTRRC